nr:orofacial cleft 1 candidate gene 1 protein [Camelus dromedarius]
MERKKFQQKALKQTKQKKSKSAEFLMVREDREASEGTGNPAFNTSSPDLSAYQTSEKKVIRRDTLARTLAAHQQKFRLRASAEPKGNEYSRNYFDPLMDEEINPRQCGMEVSGEGSGSNKIGPCPADCDLSLSKEDRGLHNKETSIAWRTGETEDYSQDTSYLEELEEHRVSVCCSSVADGTGSGEFFKHLYFLLASVFSELQLAQWRSQGFWYIILLMASLWFLRLYLHYLSQWLFLQAISTPVTKFHFSPLTVELCYPASSLDIGEESLVVVVGPLMLNAAILPLVLIRWGCQLLFASCPDVLSKLIITMGLWTVLDPLAVFIVDTVLGRLAHSGETPVADAAKLYWMFERTMQSGILGVMLTVLLYILLFVISSLILYLYCLRLHSDSWILDAFQRIHSEETKFFIPYDLEISNQELSYIVKRAEQWRGINGERRKVSWSEVDLCFDCTKETHLLAYKQVIKFCHIVLKPFTLVFDCHHYAHLATQLYIDFFLN